MLPHLSGELARLRSQEIAREAAARHHHSIQRPAFTPAGFFFSAPHRLASKARRADAGVRARIGLTLIRIGLRFVDPVAQLRGAGRDRGDHIPTHQAIP